MATWIWRAKLRGQTDVINGWKTSRELVCQMTRLRRTDNSRYLANFWSTKLAELTNGKIRI